MASAMVTTLDNNDLIGWMRKNNRAARAARTKHQSQPQKEKNLSKSTKGFKKVLQILQLQFVLEKTSRREDICLQTLTSHFICWPPNKRTLVGILQKQIANRLRYRYHRYISFSWMPTCFLFARKYFSKSFISLSNIKIFIA